MTSPTGARPLPWFVVMDRVKLPAYWVLDRERAKDRTQKMAPSKLVRQHAK